MISIPVDPVLETQVAEVLNRTGLTTETSVRMLFAHLAEHGSLPVGLMPAKVVALATDAMVPAGRQRDDR